MSEFAPFFIVNGRPGEQVSPLDRGFTYGDGLFETVALRRGQLPLWELHQQRLQAGCRRLDIPLSPARLQQHKSDLLQLARQRGIAAGVARFVVTRGAGGRGYGPPAEMAPTIVAGLFPPVAHPPERRAGVRVRVCSQRLSGNTSLAGLKHLNRLENVLARREWHDAGIAEGLLLDQNQSVVEATASNLFIVKDQVLITPPLDRCGVAGVCRQLIMETLAAELKVPVREARLFLPALREADEMLLCNSLNGIWPVLALEQWRYRRGPVTTDLQQCFEACLDERAAGR